MRSLFLEEFANKGKKLLVNALAEANFARNSPSPLFSPPAVVVESLDNLFNDPPSGAMEIRAPGNITRQESWKEDVSDAGWRAW